ncbi:MAG TPA: hypothetical protein VFK17_08720 [Gaiellaceae bacterium]|jgi:hypothetical protein|nr:hypothetical protein [Gaiellaceae bacterium]
MKLDRRALVVVVAATALAAPALALAVDQTPDTGGGSAIAGNAATSPVKGDTAKFADLAVAKQAGYGLLKDKQGISCIAMDPMPGMTMGAMGVHYASSALVGDGQLDLHTPEALVYRPVAGGKLRLAAVEYVVIKQAWDAKHNGVPVMFGHRFNTTAAGNRFGLPAFYSLHVWLFQRNPSGEFAMWNPLVKCGGAR